MQSSPSVSLTHRVNTCPGCSHDLLLCIGYANEFSSFHSFFFSRDSVSSLSSILFVSVPSSAPEPRVTLARLPAFLFLRLLFLFFSVSARCVLCPVAPCLLLKDDTDGGDLSDWLPGSSKSEWKERNRGGIMD